MQKAKLTDLVQDFNYYPRTQVDSTHVTRIAMAIEAGQELPPILVCRKSKRICDGFNRYDAHKRLKLEEIAVEYRTFKDDKEFYEVAVEANAKHGKPYTEFDRKRILIRCEELGITLDRVSYVLKNTVDSLEVRKESFGKDNQGRPVALKNTIKWKAGQKLTKRQQETNTKLSGMSQPFYANQLSELFEAELIDWSNATLVMALGRLYRNMEPYAAEFKEVA